MQIEERIVGNVTILDLKGKITLGEGDELIKDKINSLMAHDRRAVVLNLEGIPYIDSAGLGELFRSWTIVTRQGGRLVFLNLTKRIQDLLAITKLLTVVEIYESEADAVDSFGSSRFEVSCPVCRPTTWTAYVGARFLLACTQCDARFSPTVSRDMLAPLGRGSGRNESRAVTVQVKDLWWFTYYENGYGREGVHLTVGRPSTVAISGRLDLFALAIVEMAWAAAPRPRRVLFDTTQVRVASPPGQTRLNQLCAFADGSRAAIFDGPADKDRALGALGNLEGTPQSLDVVIRPRA
jgi:anti-sigma B factor antagonist